MKLTMKAFMEESGFSGFQERLVRAVVRQLGGWNAYTLQNLRECAEHGADTGWSGFTYYAETVAFYKRHKKDILALAVEEANDVGQNVLPFIAGFNCLDVTIEEVAKAIYAGKGAMVESIQNALAWYALEEVSHAWSDYCYSKGIKED